MAEDDVATTSSHCQENMTEEEFFHRLRSFPCHFTDLTHADRVSTESLEALKKRLQGIQRSLRTSKATRIPTSSDQDNPNEGASFDSILVYVSWRLKQEEEAKRMAEEALRIYPKSILVRTNMAYILWKLGELSSAKEQLTVLEEMQNSAAEFRDRVIKGRLGVAFFYYLNRHFEFRSPAIEIYEKILEEQPDNDRCKLYLARVLKNQRHGEVTMEDGSQSPLARAIDLLTAIKSKIENNAQLRAEAAAELGGILYYRCTKDVVKEKSTQLGLEPGQCFTQALDLAEDNSRVLFNAGKYYGKTDGEEKAIRLFERLVELQPDNATAYLQLGRTLTATFWKNQQKERHLGGRQSSDTPCNTPSRTIGRYRQTVSTGVRNVHAVSSTVPSSQSSMCGTEIAKRALECLLKAQALGAESTFLVLELGRLHQSVGKTDDALHYFLQVVAGHDDPFFTSRALNQAAHVLFHVRKKWRIHDNRHRNLTSLAESLLKMTAICHSRKLLKIKQRAEHWSDIWHSFLDLGSILQDDQDNFDTIVRDIPQGEKWLLRFFRRNKTFPSLQSILHMSEYGAEDPAFLQSRLRGLHSSRHYEDAALYIALLRLTSMGHVMAASDARQLQFKVHVEAALTVLRGNHGRSDIYDKLRKAVAALLFRWAFEDHYFDAEQRPYQESVSSCDGTQFGAYSTTESGGTGSITNTECDRGDADPDLDDSDPAPAPASDNRTHVLILHGSDHQNDAALLQQILQSGFGLQTICFTLDDSTLDRSLTSAAVVLFFVGNGSSTPEFTNLVAKAVAKVSNSDTDATNDTQPSFPSPDLVLSVVKGNTVIPAALQGHRSLAWMPELEGYDAERALSEDQISAVEKLFYFLIGLKT